MIVKAMIIPILETLRKKLSTAFLIINCPISMEDYIEKYIEKNLKDKVKKVATKQGLNLPKKLRSQTSIAVSFFKNCVLAIFI